MDHYMIIIRKKIFHANNHECPRIFINYFPTQSYKGTEIIKALLLIAFLKQE